jgi:hypothetical protein
MSKSSGSDLSDRPGDDSDGEGSVTSSCSHASEMPYTPDSKKRARPKQIRGKAWIFHGVITTNADRLHPKSGSNEEGPFPILVSLLHAHWTSVVQHLDDKIKKLILHLVFFCNLTSLLACLPDPKDASKVQIQIRAFLQCQTTALTALVKLLPPSHSFLSGSWQRCEGGLSGHAMYEECVQSKTANTNTWMQLLKIGDFLQNNIARHRAKKVCCYIFGFYMDQSNLWRES